MDVFWSYSWYRCRSYFTRSSLRRSIGLIRDGDEITIDLVNRTLDVNQPQEELYKRKEELEPFKAKVKQVILQDTLL